MATIAEVAKAAGVSPQTVRRFLKTELGMKLEPRKATNLNINEASRVVDHFAKQGRSVANSVSASEQERLESIAARNNELLQQVATLNERVAGLQRENDLLRERLSIADDALKREQQQSRGFWHRLGMKLLGDGKTNRTNSEGEME